ncbi:MAG: transglycosylase domain-containing protein [Chitinispirillaceae bacterium]|nr:transglycosylase domain-containing protein [Chitinispirillaceae bacterium]
MTKKIRILKIVLIIIGIGTGLIIVGAYPAYLIGKVVCYRYFNKWGKKLVDLENRGLLSKSYGAGWQDVLTEEAMNDAAAMITDRKDEDTAGTAPSVQTIDGIVLADYPSLSIINKLREIRVYSNTIEIVDRLERPIANIRTDHRRAPIEEFPSTLIEALLAAEDKNFRENNYGFEYGSFVRAALRSVFETLTSFKKRSPRGTSTITQQVAKLFISRLDEQGFRQVNRSVDRKVRELRIAVALRKMFSPDDILEVYCNHCVTSDYGMIGYADIAAGLFNKKLGELSDAECVYLARMVKWGRNISEKIIRQCHIDMPRMGEALGWDAQKQQAVLAEIDTLRFNRPRRFQGSHSTLVDLANEFWLLSLRNIGRPESEVEQMNIIDPNSLIRKKGNLTIRLTIDIGLQQRLEALVDGRGYGPDTVIIDEVRIGSNGSTVDLERPPRDTIRALRILDGPLDFHEPGSAYLTSLNAGDTVLTNIRYSKLGKNRYRRSLFHYVRKPITTNGQYFAYALMNAKTGKLLAYYSKDRLGSRLACMLQNRTPNGSSTVKPICNALNFDLGILKPNMKWTDTLPVLDDVPWKRDFDYERGKATGMVFAHSAVRGVGYRVHNHNDVFEGCQYIFDLLSSSNNILGTETMYRLNRTLFTPEGEIAPDAFPVVQLFSRIGAFSRIKDSLRLNAVTGVRVFKELARIVGVDTDSLISFGKKMPLSDSMYSVALGALEMTLYEQMHLFNMLYNNDIIEQPAKHPSLAIESIVLNGDTVVCPDTIRRYHPFTDLNSLRTTWLGLHLRLTGNRYDGLTGYDIPLSVDSAFPPPLPPSDSAFSAEAYTVDEPLSNFAKSGTTDDVIRPYNVDVTSKKRTNYGIWNAVIRIDLSKFSPVKDPDVHDVTVACIGECNEKFTGARDGKTLHKFLTKELLHQAGRKVDNGYFTRYERYLRRVPADERLCGFEPEEDPFAFPDGSGDPMNTPPALMEEPADIGAW